VDHQHRKASASPGKKSGGNGGSGGCADALGNSELAELLLEQAAREEGVDETQLLFGTHPDQFWFAEDGDDDGTTTTTRRQQDDKLPGLRPKHEGKEYEDFTDGTAFVKGANDAHAVDPNDVKQGALGDCYLIAGMAAVARADPKLIEDLIKDNGDGTFDVSLYIRPSRYGYPRPVTKTVDARLAVKASGRPLYAGHGDKEDGKTELWTAIIEKTLAQHKSSYDLISGSKIGKDGFAYAGTNELLTGQIENYFSTDGMDADEALLWIDMALEEGKPVTAGTRNLKDDPALTTEAKSQNVYWNHAYAPESVDLTAETIDLQNPWGSSHVEALSGEDFIRFYRNIRIGG
jgi:hypothetical protein